MKVVLCIIGTVVALAVVCIVVFLLLPGDVVTSRYATLREAQADNLFEHGWLPDILPASAHSIRTANDLDLNLSNGEFSFAPLDYPSLVAQLRPYTPVRTPFSDFEGEVTKRRGRGCQPGLYVEADTTWVFFCKPEKGYCEYTMWSHRG